MTPHQELQQALNDYNDLLDQFLLVNIDQRLKDIYITKIWWEEGGFLSPAHSFNLQKELAEIKEIDYDMVWRC
ncbi:MAG: hypothetical protein ACXADW_13585 [Candidatus Hodarchaeales archaeon]|jgi:hypothetical protein